VIELGTTAEVMTATARFRAAAVAAVVETWRPVKDVAFELSVGVDALRRWIYRAHQFGELIKKRDESSLDAEVRLCGPGFVTARARSGS